MLAAVFCLYVKFILKHNIGMYLLFLVLKNVIASSGQSKLEYTQKHKLIHHNLKSLLMKNAVSPNTCGTKQ